METTDIFTRVLLTDRIKIKPSLLGKNIKNVLQTILVTKYEGRCSHHGYIRSQSISIYKYSVGVIVASSLNGDIQFVVQFYADVCNPLVGSIIKAKVVNANKFAILVECSVNGQGVLEVIIAKQANTFSSDVDLNLLNKDDIVNVQILGRKYELNDRKISCLGKIVKDAATGPQNAHDQQYDEENEDNEDEELIDEEEEEEEEEEKEEDDPEEDEDPEEDDEEEEVEAEDIEVDDDGGDADDDEDGDGSDDDIEDD